MSELRLKPVNRLEAFSDAVFAVSATLLVVSLEVPQSMNALLESLAGFVGFAFSFAMLILIWVEHNRFFRQYGLQDGMTIFLNAVLLFVVLFYVYPLKFLSMSMANWMFGIGPQVIGSWQDLQLMFVVYGAGWIAVFLSFAALNWHAGRAAAGLDPLVRREAILNMQTCLLNAGVGLLSVLVAWSTFGLRFGLPGMIYALLGVVGWLQGHRIDKHRKANAGRAAPAGD